MNTGIDPRSFAVAELLPLWFWMATGVSLVVIRVSSQSEDKLASNSDAARLLKDRPTVALLLRKGGIEEVLDDPALRSELGLRPIYRSHCSPYADSQGRLVGWLLASEADNEICLLLMDTAAKMNVHIPHDLTPSNAVVALFQQFFHLDPITQVFVNTWDRLVRTELFGHQVVTAAHLGGVQIYKSKKAMDIYSRAGRAGAASESSASAAWHDGIAESTTNGVLSKLMAEEMAWPRSSLSLPPGYAVGAISRRKRPGKNRPERLALMQPDVAHAAGWLEFFQAVAANKPWPACGLVLAKHRIPARGAKFTGRNYADLSPKQLTVAARTNASLTHWHELHDLVYKVDTPAPMPADPGEGTWLGYKVSPGLDYGRIKLDITLPAHNITLTDAEWASWLARVIGRTTREPQSERPTAIGSGIARYSSDDASEQFNLTRQAAYYQLRCRPRAAGFDASGVPRGWDNAEGTLVASVEPRRFDAALSRLVLDGGRTLLDRGAVFARPDARPPDDAEGRRERAELAHSGLCDRILDVEEDLAVAHAALDAAPDRSRSRRQQEVVEAEELLAQLKADRLRLETCVDTPDLAESTESHSVDVAGFAALAAVIAAGAGQLMPRIVNDSLRGLVKDSVRMEIAADNSRELILSAVLRAKDENGEFVAVPVSTRVRNASIAGRSATSAGEALSRMVLAEGNSVDEAVTALGLTRPSAVRAARKWLLAHGVSTPSRASALLDCPIKTTKQIGWALISEQETAEDPRFVEHIRGAYFADTTRWPHSWAVDVASTRRIFSMLAAMEGRGRSLADGVSSSEISQATGLAAATVLQSGEEGRRRRRCGALLRHERDVRVLLPRRCRACGDWMLHIVLTPETVCSHGLVCSGCLQMIDGTPVPPEYAALWDAMPSIADNKADIDTRPVTYLGVAAHYSTTPPPGKRTRLVSIKEAALITGVPAHVLRAGTSSGELPCIRRGKLKERWFDQADLATYATAHAPRDGHVPGVRGVPSGYLTLKQAAVQSCVGEHHLRHLARSTGPTDGPLPFARVHANSHADVIIIKSTDLELVDADWLLRYRAGRVTFGRVLEITGLTPAQIRRVMATGDLTHFKTDGGTAMFDEVTVRAWMRGPGRPLTLLQPHQAAARAGLSVDTITRAMDVGDLPAENTSWGHRRLDPDVVDAWLGRRRGTARQSTVE